MGAKRELEMKCYRSNWVLFQFFIFPVPQCSFPVLVTFKFNTGLFCFFVLFCFVFCFGANLCAVSNRAASSSGASFLALHRGERETRVTGNEA